MKVVKKHLKRYFLSGLLVVVPISLTVYILKIIINFTDRLYPIVRVYLPVYVPGFGIIITFTIIMVVGVVATNILGKRLVLLGEMIIDSIPLVKDIYNAIKQIAEAMFMLEDKSFRRVVLIEYPRKGIYTMAFVTGSSKKQFQDKVGCKLLNIFVPTTPNPTSGFFLMVPEDDVVVLDISPEEAFKLIVSGGLATK